MEAFNSWEVLCPVTSESVVHVGARSYMHFIFLWILSKSFVFFLTLTIFFFVFRDLLNENSQLKYAQKELLDKLEAQQKEFDTNQSVSSVQNKLNVSVLNFCNYVMLSYASTCSSCWRVRWPFFIFELNSLRKRTFLSFQDMFWWKHLSLSVHKPALSITFWAEKVGVLYSCMCQHWLISHM